MELSFKFTMQMMTHRCDTLSKRTPKSGDLHAVIKA